MTKWKAHFSLLIKFAKLFIKMLIEHKKETLKPSIHAGFKVSNLVRETRLELKILILVKLIRTQKPSV